MGLLYVSGTSLKGAARRSERRTQVDERTLSSRYDVSIENVSKD